MSCVVYWVRCQGSLCAAGLDCSDTDDSNRSEWHFRASDQAPDGTGFPPEIQDWICSYVNGTGIVPPFCSSTGTGCDNVLYGTATLGGIQELYGDPRPSHTVYYIDLPVNDCNGDPIDYCHGTYCWEVNFDGSSQSFWVEGAFNDLALHGWLEFGLGNITLLACPTTDNTNYQCGQRCWCIDFAATNPSDSSAPSCLCVYASFDGAYALAYAMWSRDYSTLNFPLIRAPSGDSECTSCPPTLPPNCTGKILRCGTKIARNGGKLVAGCGQEGSSSGGSIPGHSGCGCSDGTVPGSLTVTLPSDYFDPSTGAQILAGSYSLEATVEDPCAYFISGIGPDGRGGIQAHFFALPGQPIGLDVWVCAGVSCLTYGANGAASPADCGTLLGTLPLLWLLGGTPPSWGPATVDVG